MDSQRSPSTPPFSGVRLRREKDEHADDAKLAAQIRDEGALAAKLAHYLGWMHKRAPKSAVTHTHWCTGEVRGACATTMIHERAPMSHDHDGDHDEHEDAIWRRAAHREPRPRLPQRTPRVTGRTCTRAPPRRVPSSQSSQGLDAAQFAWAVSHTNDPTSEASQYGEEPPADDDGLYCYYSFYEQKD